MEINESKELELKMLGESIQASQKGIRFAQRNLGTLNMGNEQEEEEEEEDGGGIDPTRFLTRQEAAEWERLSPSQKERFIKDGLRQAGKELKKKGKGQAVGEAFRDHLMEARADDEGLLGRHHKSHAMPHASQPEKKGGASGLGTPAAEGSLPERQRMGDTGAVQNGEQMALKRCGGIHEGGTVEIAESGQPLAAGTAGAKAAGTSAAQAGTATGGLGIAVQAGKKAAGAFKESLESRSMAAGQGMQQAQQLMQQVKAENRAVGTLPSAVAYAGAAVAAAAIGAATVMFQVAATLITTLLAVLAMVLVGVIAAAVIVSTVVAFIVSIATSLTDTGAGDATQIVSVALAEEGTADGSRYWRFTMGTDDFVDGSATPWCACFVSWCANECGLIDDGIFPKSASVASYRRFFREKELLHEEGNYIPKAGDLILFGADEHIGIVQYTEHGRVVTIEGNTSDAVHTRSYSLGSSYITGYCTPEYPAGEEIAIPDGMGIYHTYMGWRTVTSPTSLQYQLREESGENYDEEGFAKIDGRYVIACTATFGNVGDYVDFYREDGTIVHAVIGDIKNQDDPGCNRYGHADGQCVVEYVVQQSTWYPSHANPGTAGCHPEWNSRIVKAVKLNRNYFG